MFICGLGDIRRHSVYFIFEILVNYFILATHLLLEAAIRELATKAGGGEASKATSNFTDLPEKVDIQWCKVHFECCLYIYLQALQIRLLCIA